MTDQELTKGEHGGGGGERQGQGRELKIGFPAQTREGEGKPRLWVMTDGCESDSS